MPEYGTQVTYEAKKGAIYEIQSAEEITTRNNLSGVRVELKAQDKHDLREYAVTLWPSSQVNSTSKWGSFCAVLGSNTDNWLHKWIRIVNWQDRQCEIQLVPAPRPVGKLAKEAVDKLDAEITR